VLALLTFTAEARPGYRIQAGFRDGMSADLADSESALLHPGQCPFNGSPKTLVGFVQADLKLRFRICGSLVDKISV
jgi:hypothetical protein